jgi:hypothetical protein
MTRRGARCDLVTMCIGVGREITTFVEGTRTPSDEVDTWQDQWLKAQ